MGELVQTVVGLAQGLYGQIKSGLSSGTVKNYGPYIDNVATWVEALVSGIAWVFGQEAGAVKYSAQYVHNFTSWLGAAESAREASFTRLTDVILPASFAHLVQYVYTTWVVPINNDLQGLHNQVSALVQSLNAIDGWITNTANPDLYALLVFRQGLISGYMPQWDVLNDWLARPGDFGQWAAAPIIGPLVAYLADPAHKLTRDNLTAIIAQAWSEEAEGVWEDVQQWLTANT